jgi:predicted transcriptional regulator
LELEKDNVELATELTTAWLANPNTQTDAEGARFFLSSMIDALSGFDRQVQAKPEGQEQATPREQEQVFMPAVSVRRSLADPDYIVSMIDGKPYKVLRHHLMQHGLTPEQYRERYNLAADYPMVSATYSEKRRVIAKQIGLGRRSAGEAEAAQGRLGRKDKGSKELKAETP